MSYRGLGEQQGCRTTIHPLPLLPSILKTDVEGTEHRASIKKDPKYQVDTRGPGMICMMNDKTASTTDITFASHPYREQDSLQGWLMAGNIAYTYGRAIILLYMCNCTAVHVACCPWSR